ENLQLRQPPGPVPTPPLPTERAEHTPMAPGGSTHRRDRQAFSMYEPGSALKPFGGPPGDELTTRLQPFHSTELEDDAIYSVHVPAGLYRAGREEVSRAGQRGRLPPRAGKPGWRPRSWASQHRGCHLEDRAGHQEHSGTVAGSPGVQA
ncbi:GIT1 isoform 6, partial [Pan troglodytes]